MESCYRATFAMLAVGCFFADSCPRIFSVHRVLNSVCVHLSDYYKCENGMKYLIVYGVCISV
jgi:hypothetical protein